MAGKCADVRDLDNNGRCYARYLNIELLKNEQVREAFTA
jgi:hypothetical protein